MKVEDIIEDISMGPFGSDIKVEYFTTSGVPLLNGSNLQKVKLIEEVENYVTEEKAQELKKALARPHDIIITHRGTLGQASYVPEGIQYPYFLISQSQFRVRFKAEEVYAPYIAYYLHSSEGQGKLLSFKNHVGVPALARATSNFRKLQFNLPEIDEQKRIANTLIAFDEKIEHNNELIKMLEEQAQLLYDYWFMQFDFPDENGKPYRSSGGKMVWNDKLKREIPDGWEVVTLGECGEFRNGVNYGKDEHGDTSYKIINVRNISSSRHLINLEDLDIVNLSAKKGSNYIVNPSDIIIARSGVPGATRLMYVESANIIFCGFIIAFSPSNADYRNYLYYQLKGYEGTSATTTGGTILQNVSQGTLKRLVLPKPSVEIAKQFNKTIECLYARMHVVQQEVSHITKQRDFLLPLLMSGQVKVAE